MADEEPIYISVIYYFTDLQVVYITAYNILHF